MPMATPWKSDVYRLLPVCHLYIKVGINFSASRLVALFFERAFFSHNLLQNLVPRLPNYSLSEHMTQPVAERPRSISCWRAISSWEFYKRSTVVQRTKTSTFENSILKRYVRKTFWCGGRFKLRPLKWTVSLQGYCNISFQEWSCACTESEEFSGRHFQNFGKWEWWVCWVDSLINWPFLPPRNQPRSKIGWKATCISILFWIELCCSASWRLILAFHVIARYFID
jgi:hypothetical protein